VARKPWKAGAIAGLVLLAVACGDDGATSPSASGRDAASTTAGAPITDPDTDATSASSTSPDGSGTTEPGADVPARIVSLSPTHTETLFAIGAGPQVIAVDEQSNHPPEAAEVRTELSGFTPNVEAIAAYEPDLVVLSGDPTTASQLEELGITAWDGPSAQTFEDAFAQWEQLGAITGHVAEAAELVADAQRRLDELVASLPEPETPLALYHELTPDGYSATSSTFIGRIYAMFGLENIADAAADDTLYPQLNAETIIEADPDLIFLADAKCCGENLETVAARDGWADITAVANGHVFAMDDDLASRWSPRFVEYAAQVRDAVEQVLVAAG
jgi:iron complex transport system substrate-binding protein